MQTCPEHVGQCGVGDQGSGIHLVSPRVRGPATAMWVSEAAALHSYSPG